MMSIKNLFRSLSLTALLTASACAHNIKIEHLVKPEDINGKNLSSTTQNLKITSMPESTRVYWLYPDGYATFLGNTPIKVKSIVYLYKEEGKKTPIYPDGKLITSLPNNENELADITSLYEDCYGYKNCNINLKQ